MLNDLPGEKHLMIYERMSEKALAEHADKIAALIVYVELAHPIHQVLVGLRIESRVELRHSLKQFGGATCATVRLAVALGRTSGLLLRDRDDDWLLGHNSSSADRQDIPLVQLVQLKQYRNYYNNNEDHSN